MIEQELDDVFVVIPAKDEAQFIRPVLDTTIALGFSNIIVVDDNSSDETRNIAQSYSKVTVLEHIVNLGAGAATKTGIDYAVSKGAQYVATIDADFQHNPKDLIPLVKCIRSKDYDLVIGSRFLKKNGVPFSRLILNFIGNIINFFITGLIITDSQSGMKVMSRRFAKDLAITFNGYEFCIEIIKNAKISKRNIYEYPINVLYTKETMGKGQNVFNGFEMVGKLFNPFKS